MTTGPQNKSINTWKPTTAGILSIVAGVIAVLVGLWTFRRHEFIGRMTWHGRWEVLGVLSLVLGAVAITGGIFTLRRRVWGMALAGAICALFPPHIAILGILAIIFIVLSKGEFSQSNKKETKADSIPPESMAPKDKNSST